MVSNLDILETLVGFPSVSAQSNLPIIDYIQDFLSKRGFLVKRIADTTGQKAGLFASIGPGGPGGVMLSGHTDVVPVEGQAWSSDPFTLRHIDGRAYGRGTADMKGNLACMMALADRAKTRALTAPLKLAFSFDEEVGCLGIPQMLPVLDTVFGTPAMCFVGEPTSMRIATGHKGKAALRTVCRGTAGHSAQAPEYLNALHLAADFVMGLRALQTQLKQGGTPDTAYSIPYSTLHAGKLSGGTALNIVPERAVIDWELRNLATDDATAILQQVTQMAEDVARAYRSAHPDAAISVETLFTYPGLETAPNAPVTRFAAALLPEGRGLTKVGYGTEAGYFDAAGIPTIVCGPGNMDQGHKPDEFIEIDQLVQCDAMLDQLLGRLESGDMSV